MSKSDNLICRAGGVTAPRGFTACGVAAGIKPGRNDMAMIVSGVPAAAAGVFTLNRFKAAPVIVTERHLRRGACARAVIVNAGNANACTGKRGLRDAELMARETARVLNTHPGSILVCSTGTIGIPLPMAKIKRGIALAARALRRSGGGEAARAIMTTDTRAKLSAVSFTVGDREVRIGAMAKGAGMIAPNMATMLAFITTDAAVEKNDLRFALREAVETSFNRILVDGDQSTNDTVLCLANGLALNEPLNRRSRHWGLFQSALDKVCGRLAHEIVSDGEGVTKVVRINVRGARTEADAEMAARSIARSLLVKTSWFGADPNWGRVVCAVGYSGAAVAPGRIRVEYDGLPAVIRGVSSGLPPARLHRVIAKREFTIGVDLGLGRGKYSILTCDCSLDYVRINADYMT